MIYRKWNPYVSASFTLNSSKDCVVKLYDVQDGFLSLVFFFKISCLKVFVPLKVRERESERERRERYLGRPVLPR